MRVEVDAVMPPGGMELDGAAVLKSVRACTVMYLDGALLGDDVVLVLVVVHVVVPFSGVGRHAVVVLELPVPDAAAQLDQVELSAGAKHKSQGGQSR